jgi:hypothetical protein
MLEMVIQTLLNLLINVIDIAVENYINKWINSHNDNKRKDTP